jgi:predicted dithiol-disulfide oxidoreductase (DUF899 family)
MTPHKIVSHQEWVEARKDFLTREKEFSRMHDELSAARRELPWERVEKEYVFEGPSGKVSLADLFDGRSQLIVYHFMLGPDWPEGCPSCSLLADHNEPSAVHLNQRDVSMVTISNAPLENIEAFRARMGWNIMWLSSLGNDFNRDYHVSFAPEEQQSQDVYYNYQMGSFPMTEAPGVSVFTKDDDGAIYHSYSSYARGLDMFLGVYQLLDIVPKGRDEAALSFPMAWVRHHDRYGNS